MKIRIVSIAFLVLAAVLFCSVLGFELYHAGRIYPGVRVQGVDLGGLRPDQAAAALTREMRLSDPLVTLRGPERSWQVSPVDLGVRLDAQATVEAAYNLGREFWWGENLLSHLELLSLGLNLPPVIVYDEQTTRLYLETLAEQIDFPPTEASLSLDGLTPVVTTSQPGQRLDVEQVVRSWRTPGGLHFLVEIAEIGRAELIYQGEDGGWVIEE